jgi:hypothetical protein
MTVIANSTFLDAFGDKEATAQQFAALTSSSSLAIAQSVLGQLYAENGVPASVSVAPNADMITVGLVLNRANDPTTLLESSWAVREAGLANQSAVFATYGALPTTFGATLAATEAAIGPGGAASFQAASDAGYISSAADRTIWLTLNATQFSNLFGTQLLEVNAPGLGYTQLAWGGDLNLAPAIAANVGGLWFENGAAISNPAVLNLHGVTLAAGPLGIGNSSTSPVSATPAAIAANYNFPLGNGGATGPIALVETDVPSQAALFTALNQYRVALGLSPMSPAQFQVLSGSNDPGTPNGEITLDVSVLASAAPNSTQLLYSFGDGSPYNAYQQAFFDFTHNPAVVSSSYGSGGQPTADSPFQWAFQQLFVDAALRNISVMIAAGDQGSSGAIANGVANAFNSQSPLWALAVGGTSIANLHSALADPTLSNLVGLALQDDPATVFSLVASGLTTLPTHLVNAASPAPAAVLTSLFESVWESLVLQPSSHGLSAPFGANETGSGGVATSLPVPFYQSEFGLDPTGSTGSGRGVPDVSALSFGDTFYAALNPGHVTNPSTGLFANSGGTSAATPLWAALTSEFNVVFHDQGLPNLGFYNDLLYTAAAVAPGSFNDTLLGNNINSFFQSLSPTGYFDPATGTYMVPTGDGFSAAPGFDLASGLGTPNGMLLARALTDIAHSQMFFESVPDMVNSNGHGGWTSGADQTLLFETMAPGGANVGLNVGPDAFGFFSAPSGSFAWTSQLAEQSLQPDFDPALVIMFDKQAQGGLLQEHVSSGAGLIVSINGAAGQAVQADLTGPFGLADFFSSSGAVRAARPVAIAETADGGSNETAIVRVRQDGQDNLSLTFYRVDDLSGTINGLHPGDAGYQAAVQARAYQLSSGATSLGGPGYGNYEQADLMHVNAGDLIAMQLTNNTHGNTYSAFAQANETVNGQHVGHLWNYGLNTWGWEDTFGGGDHDYNDMVVQLDFTSASGHGFLV